MEEYYEEYFGGDNEEFYDNPYFCCDVILLNNNNFYFLTSVYEFEIDKITKSNDIIKDKVTLCPCFSNIFFSLATTVSSPPGI